MRKLTANYAIKSVKEMSDMDEEYVFDLIIEDLSDEVNITAGASFSGSCSTSTSCGSTSTSTTC